jgi:putative colanic acid biosynthesis acetyltransferase WcaF
MPGKFRGKPAWVVQLWWLVDSLLFRTSPQILYPWRRFLLRIFGARIGEGVLVRPTARITYPWKVSIGDHSWIGDEVVLYSLGEISIGSDVVVSQRSYLCAATHDYTKRTFDIFARPIRIGHGVWLATDVFVAPGIHIGDGTVVGARSSVFSDLPEMTVCHGSPARVVKPRPVQGC